MEFSHLKNEIKLIAKTSTVVKEISKLIVKNEGGA
jgi:hypothetical protein